MTDSKETVRKELRAVALAYEQRVQAAPSVVANGEGHVAAEIKRVARRYAIPTANNKALAHKLSEVEEESEIPEDLYLEVAKLFCES